MGIQGYRGAQVPTPRSLLQLEVSNKTFSYHIQRVHSLQFGCVVCKSRFTQSRKGQSKKATAEEAKLSHECRPRDFTDEDPPWMTEEQELRFANWKEPGKAQEGGAKSWIKIYMCLFETAENDVPNPC